MRLIAQFRNTVVLGDCVEVMRRMESASVDFILIDTLPLSLRVVTDPRSRGETSSTAHISRAG